MPYLMCFAGIFSLCIADSSLLQEYGKRAGCPKPLEFPQNNDQPEVTELFQAHTVLWGLCSFL